MIKIFKKINVKVLIQILIVILILFSIGGSLKLYELFQQAINSGNYTVTQIDRVIHAIISSAVIWSTFIMILCLGYLVQENKIGVISILKSLFFSISSTLLLPGLMIMQESNQFVVITIITFGVVMVLAVFIQSIPDHHLERLFSQNSRLSNKK